MFAESLDEIIGNLCWCILLMTDWFSRRLKYDSKFDLEFLWNIFLKIVVILLFKLHFFKLTKTILQYISVRNTYMTKSNWQNDMTESWQKQTLTIEHDQNWNPTNLNLTSRVLLTSVPDGFFLAEEWSDGPSKAGQVRAYEPGLGDLSKPTAPAFFGGVKLMFVVVVFFGHVQLLRFFIVKNFRSCSNTNFWSYLLGHVN